MKTQIFTLLALASSATATFQWLDAKKFDCPANTDNKCTDTQKNGLSWEGLNLGSFTNFGDFDFNGFECADSFDGTQKRDQITGRTFQNKCIKGKVTKEKTPSFGCGSSKKVEKFSVKTFQISVEFDINLEFHYDMPNGSVCKQKQLCKKSGTTVKNTQCGGATKVKVTIPKGQKDKSCDIGFHHIDFDCEKPQTVSSTTVRPSTAPVTLPASTPVSTASETPSATLSASASVSESPSASAPASETENLPTPTPESSTSSISPLESTTPVEATTPAESTIPAESTPVETPASETPASETEDLPTPTPTPESTTSSISPVESTVPPFGNTTTPPPSETTPTATLPDATTIFQTSPVTITHISTITSCGPEVPDCPAGSSTVITETSVTSTIIPITTSAPPAPEQTTVIIVDHTTVIVETSTTLCPVTLTHITQGTTAIETTLSTSTIILTQTSTICTKCTSVPTTIVETPIASSPVATTPIETSSIGPITTTTTPSVPVPTSDCPAILPQCLNTWLFSAGCSSNTDSNCFCSSTGFVDNVYKCLAAHGASDDEVDAAEKYFQGICAPQVPENPAIITGVNTLTLTATPSAQTQVPVTTIILQTTIVVPCTETAGPSEGSIIPGSSTQVIISTAVTVPQVVFETITGTSTNVVSLVQGTPTAPATLPAFTTPLVSVPAQTTFAPLPTTFASQFNPGNATGTAAPPQFTGAASRSGLTAGSFIAAGLVALMAL